MPLLNVGAGQTKRVTPRYEVCNLIDTGSFAEVYRAYDNKDGVEVALKVYIKPVTAADTDPRVKREIAVLNKLKGSEFFPDRPASMVQHVKQERRHILVMELGEYRWQEEAPAEGAGPRRRSRKAILPLDQVVPRLGSADLPPEHRPEFWNAESLMGWVVDLCEAVRLMHDKDVLHLDLKPANVLLKRGADRQRSVPFLIDFNTSVAPGASKFEGATEDYRAPEVRPRPGARDKPAVADDLYALALILTEIHFGLGSHKRARDAALRPHAHVPYPVDGLRKVLLHALDGDPKKRFATALEFKQAVSASLAPDPARPAGLSPEEMAYIRKEGPRFRENIEEVFTGQLSLYVSKNLRDEVSSLFSNLSAEATDSLDLRERLLALGQKAAPAIFEEGYKLDMDSPHFPVVVEALAEFGRLEEARLKDHPNDFVPNRVTRNLDDYRLSSNYVVRRLCRELCRKLGIFTDGQREILREGPDILLPDERDEVADLCLTCGATETDLRALLLYMCDQYFADIRAYRDLRHRVAARIVNMPVKGKACLISAWAYEHLWEEAQGYRQAGPREQPELARGVFPLIGDAFASLGEEALTALRSGAMRERTGGSTPRALWQPFAVKLARASVGTRQWLLAAKDAPQGISSCTLKHAQEKVSEGGRDDPKDVEQLFQEYMRFGEPSVLNQLVWSPRLGEILALADAAVGGDPGAAGRVLALLRRCESKSRSKVLSIAFKHYPVFSAVNYRELIRVVCQAGLPDRRTRDEAIKQLTADLDKPDRHDLAVEWLDRLLEDD